MELIENIRSNATKTGLVSVAVLSLMSTGNCGGFDLNGLVFMGGGLSLNIKTKEGFDKLLSQVKEEIKELGEMASGEGELPGGFEAKAQRVVDLIKSASVHKEFLIFTEEDKKIREGIERLESLLTAQIEIETITTDSDPKQAAIYSSGRELARSLDDGDANGTSVKAFVSLLDLVKGIKVINHDEDTIELEYSKRPVLKKDGKGTSNGDSVIKPFGENIKKLMEKIDKSNLKSVEIIVKDI